MNSTNLDSEARQFQNRGPAATNDIAETFAGLEELLQQILDYEIANHGVGSADWITQIFVDLAGQWGGAAIFGLVTKGLGAIGDVFNSDGKWFKPKGRSITRDGTKFLDTLDANNKYRNKSIQKYLDKPQKGYETRNNSLQFTNAVDLKNTLKMQEAYGPQFKEMGFDKPTIIQLYKEDPAFGAKRLEGAADRVGQFKDIQKHLATTKHPVSSKLYRHLMENDSQFMADEHEFFQENPKHNSNRHNKTEFDKYRADLYAESPLKFFQKLSTNFAKLDPQLSYENLIRQTIHMVPDGQLADALTEGTNAIAKTGEQLTMSTKRLEKLSELQNIARNPKLGQEYATQLAEHNELQKTQSIQTHIKSYLDNVNKLYPDGISPQSKETFDKLFEHATKGPIPTNRALVDKWWQDVNTEIDTRRRSLNKTALDSQTRFTQKTARVQKLLDDQRLVQRGGAGRDAMRDPILVGDGRINYVDEPIDLDVRPQRAPDVQLGVREAVPQPNVIAQLEQDVADLLENVDAEFMNPVVGEDVVDQAPLNIIDARQQQMENLFQMARQQQPARGIVDRVRQGANQRLGLQMGGEDVFGQNLRNDPTTIARREPEVLNVALTEGDQPGQFNADLVVGRDAERRAFQIQAQRNLQRAAQRTQEQLRTYQQMRQIDGLTVPQLKQNYSLSELKTLGLKVPLEERFTEIRRRLVQAVQELEQ